MYVSNLTMWQAAKSNCKIKIICPVNNKDDDILSIQEKLKVSMKPYTELINVSARCLCPSSFPFHPSFDF